MRETNLCTEFCFAITRSPSLRVSAESAFSSRAAPEFEARRERPHQYRESDRESLRIAVRKRVVGRI
jgi:hypothetical protein